MTKGSSPVAIVLSVIAIVVSLVAIVVSFVNARRQHSENVSQYLAEVWHDILSLSHASTMYVDITRTESFESRMSDLERAQYDVYCLMVWGHIEQIVAKDFHRNPQFRAVIHWAVAYHMSWLKQSPMFFPLRDFWSTIEMVKDEPQLVLRYKPLPQRDGDIDWDVVCQDYHNYILGPFDPEMVKPDDTGSRRNLLLDDLLAFPSKMLGGAELADFGCGPGHLMEHLSGKVRRLTGVDKSLAALERAKIIATSVGIEFESIEADLRTLDLNRDFDIIVCTNAVLPQTRSDAVVMLRVIREHLAPDGRLMAILPSYDTTLYLRTLWHSHYTDMLGDADHAHRIVERPGSSKEGR